MFVLCRVIRVSYRKYQDFTVKSKSNIVYIISTQNYGHNAFISLIIFQITLVCCIINRHVSSPS